MTCWVRNGTSTAVRAASRRSIGISVVSGMLASTCLAVLFVPSFYVVIQRLAERGKKGKPAALPPQEPIAAAE